MRELVISLAVIACGPAPRRDTNVGPGPHPDALCVPHCSQDLRSVLDCNDQLVASCTANQQCDTTSAGCEDACTAAEANHRSVGCDYFATAMDVEIESYCFAAFVANTWTSPVHIGVSYKGQTLAPASFARIPVGSGPGLTYANYDPVAGLPPGQVAILFLAGGSGAPPMCPVTTPQPAGGTNGTGIFDSFHITTDVPVVAYQINPYGGGSAAVTAASLLIPTSAWDTEYVAVNVSAAAAGNPSLNIIARDDGTTVTMVPNAAVSGGGGIPSGSPGVGMGINLNAGQHAQITQSAELTGSIVTSNKPIGFMAGQNCMNMPVGVTYCDHGEQMVPPVHALGNEYVGVMYRPRVAAETSTFWRIVGAVDGTTLTWSSAVGGPPTLSKGESVTFQTGTPFVVSSQDMDHPFALFAYMTSSSFVQEGYGDPDFVVVVPPAQYLSQYVFFADPTYPETNLVIVRAKGSDQQFHDVTLDCAGTLTGWTPIGTDEYEFTRVDLMTHNFQNVGNCSTGGHEIHSDGPFGLWVWGWGTPETTTFTANVSYGYPGGMNVQPINNVIVQ